MNGADGTGHGQNARARSGEGDRPIGRPEGWGSRERRWSRRLIDPAEAVALEALGRHLAATRRGAKLTQAAVAERAELSVSHLGKLEAGARRTRASTLARIAAALDPDRAVDLTDGFIALAGPALAAESEFTERVHRRRTRRFAQGQAAKHNLSNDGRMSP